MSVHDKTSGRGADVVERKTGDERQRWPLSDIEDVNFIGSNDLCRVNDIVIGACVSGERNFHARCDAPERAEEGVSVTGESHCSQAAGNCCAANVPETLAEDAGS